MADAVKFARNNVLRMAAVPVAMAGAIWGSAAFAQSNNSDAPARAAVVQQLIDCRAVADPAERLACYDRQVAAFETAETNRDIRIVDREQVRRTRRGLFGLSLPNIGNLFGGSDEDDAEREGGEGITQITSTITQVTTGEAGRNVFVLENGQAWMQVESAGGRRPRAGQPIVVRRASLGGFIANVADRPGFRVVRVR